MIIRLSSHQTCHVLKLRNVRSINLFSFRPYNRTIDYALGSGSGSGLGLRLGLRLGLGVGVEVGVGVGLMVGLRVG